MEKVTKMSDGILGIVDAFFNDTGDNDEVSSAQSISYLSLYRRMELVVKVLSREKRKDEATKCIFDFFSNFKDIEKLERSITEAEEIIVRDK